MSDTRLIILSELVGTPGDEYLPKPGVNVDALIANGFIVRSDNPQVSTNPAPKPRKVKTKQEE
jgi:hypothetical protein